MMKTGKEKLIEQFLADGIHYMFGNPGTVEQGFLDVMNNYDDFHYITCLQESVAVAMADGYARKTKQPALIQLHSGVGLGNGIGMLYQAYRGHSPLIVIAGEAGVRYEAMDAQMSCDLVRMAEPVTKYAVRVTHRDSLLRLVRRAVKMAMTPPMGPVFLSLPMDVLEEENTEEVRASVFIDTQTVPEQELIKKTAGLFIKAQNPIIILGDGVDQDKAQEEVLETAELLGAKVLGVNTSCMNFPQSSCFYQGDPGHMFGESSRKAVQGADAVLILGTYLFPEVFPDRQTPFMEDTFILHIDSDAFEIAKNHPVSYGIRANIKLTLQNFNQMLKENESGQDKENAQIRCELLKKGKEEKIKAQQSAAEERMKNGGRTDAFFRRLQEKIKESHKELIIFDESLTSSSFLTEYFPCDKPDTFYQTRGGSLGVGIPGAMGIKLADRKKEVIGFTGDGGSMYTIQALYTAARYGIGAKFVICNNGSYRLLENNINAYWEQEGIEPHAYPECFSLNPETDFVKLSEAMGVKAVRVTCTKEATEAAEQLLAEEGPFLVELVFD